MIPKIDIIKWHYEMDISIDDIAELVDLFEEARTTNMLVNKMIRKMVEIVGYHSQSRVAMILGVSPSMVSLRVRDRAGISDRVHRFSPASGIGYVLDLFGIFEPKSLRIIKVYEHSPAKYSTPDSIKELLNAFDIYSKADAIVNHLFS